jgi:hypothetical protein
MNGSHLGLAGAAPDDVGGRVWIHAMVREMCWVTWEDPDCVRVNGCMTCKETNTGGDSVEAIQYTLDDRGSLPR